MLDEFCPICGSPNCLLKHRGKWGWLLIGGVVVAWDLIANDSLSAAFGRCDRKVTATATAVTTLHLFGLLPKKCDPFYILLGIARR